MEGLFYNVNGGYDDLHLEFRILISLTSTVTSRASFVATEMLY